MPRYSVYESSNGDIDIIDNDICEIVASFDDVDDAETWLKYWADNNFNWIYC